MITITMLDGPMVGASRVQDGLDDHVWAEYEVSPKVALRPDQVLRTDGPVFHRYTFVSWLIEGESANYTYVGGL